MKLIVGLGNPTQEYEFTRHNIGFMAIDEVFLAFGGGKWKKKFESYYCTISIQGEQFVLVKPQTYMNLSGNSIKKWCTFYRLAAEDVFVLYDDMDIPFADIKLKASGSSGGHNGLKSTIAQLGSEHFRRIRLGIGRVTRKEGSSVNHVLGKFSRSEQAVLQAETFPRVVKLVEALGQTRFELLMTEYNQKRSK